MGHRRGVIALFQSGNEGSMQGQTPRTPARLEPGDLSFRNPEAWALHGSHPRMKLAGRASANTCSSRGCLERLVQS